MDPLDRAVMDALAEHFYTHERAVMLWVQAGGSARQVPEVSGAATRWHMLWTRAGAGAAVSQHNLALSALDRDHLPANAALLAWLRGHTSDGERVRAQELTSRLLTVEASIPDVTELLEEFEPIDVGALAPCLEGRISPQRRGELARVLEPIVAGVAVEVISGGVKAGAASVSAALYAALGAG